jgi:hypothetical protein
MQTLDYLMQQQLPEGGIAVPSGCDLHMEVIDITSGLVWMSYEAVIEADYLELELGDSFRGVGIARAAMDMAQFQYSPGAPEEPVRERMIGGHRFINVGKPRMLTAPLQHGNMKEIMVEKAHVIGFDTGRSLTILSLPEGDFVEVVGSAENDHQLVLPEGASLKQITLSQPWVVTLPNPTQTIWSFAPQTRSFQGPVVVP